MPIGGQGTNGMGEDVLCQMKRFWGAGYPAVWTHCHWTVHWQGWERKVLCYLCFITVKKKRRNKPIHGKQDGRCEACGPLCSRLPLPQFPYKVWRGACSHLTDKETRLVKLLILIESRLLLWSTGFFVACLFFQHWGSKARSHTC